MDTLRRQTKHFFGPVIKGLRDLWILMLHMDNLPGMCMGIQNEESIRSMRFPPAIFAPPTRLIPRRYDGGRNGGIFCDHEREK